RHGEAERSEPGMEERAHKLIDRGWKDAAKVGAYMASHALVPDRVITSPSARTLETWKSVASAFRPPPAAAPVERLYDATAQSILAVVRRSGSASQRLFLLGTIPASHASRRSLSPPVMCR